MIRSPKGNNNPTVLAHNTSVFNLKANLPPPDQSLLLNGVRMYNLPSALVYCSPAFYTRNTIDARVALSLIRDVSEVLSVLLEHGHSTLAGRLAGAFRNMRRDNFADQIIDTFKQANYDVRETDPFADKPELNLSFRERGPYANRIRLMWKQMRATVISVFPAAPGIPVRNNEYLRDVDSMYVTDAYHSLSIERYRVTPSLIEKVSSGKWDSNNSEEDRKQRDAMAARGYYQAFQEVRKSIAAILNGSNPGRQVDTDHPKWYRQLFDPSVAAGILKVADLAGYSNQQVYIGNSRHVPLDVNAMRDAMPVLFELLEAEPEASVRAVLGHFIFVFIHPYMDGNGRMGRFLMNAMLASGGYPWTVIPVEKRQTYMQALEQASLNQDISEFAAFIAWLVNERMRGNSVAELPAGN